MSNFNDDFKVLKVDDALKSKMYLIIISYRKFNKILIQVHSCGSLRYIWRSFCYLSITLSKELALSQVQPWGLWEFSITVFYTGIICKKHVSNGLRFTMSKVKNALTKKSFLIRSINLCTCSKSNFDT